MEALQTAIVIESYFLGVALCLAAWYFYGQSKRITDMRVVGVMSLFFYFCLPGIVGAFSPLILRTVIPLDRIDVQLPTAIALLLMVVSVLAGILIRLGPPKRISAKKEGKLARQMAIRYRPGALFLVSFLFFCIGLVGVYVELHAAGGWFSVIERGGSAYLEARVTKAAGIWAVLVTFIPIAAIGMMHSVLRSRAVPYTLRWPIVLAILLVCIGVISMLTTRHLSMMLLLAVLAILEVRSGKLFRVIAPVMLGLILVAAFALASIRYSSRRPDIDKVTGNLEQVKISEEIIGKIDINGYILGGNIPDLFVFMIPRSIWPNKPVNSTINRAIFSEWAKSGGVKVVGLLGEAYASGGLVWVVLEGFIYGVMLRRLQPVWDRRRKNSFQFMAYGAVIIGYAYMSARMGFIGPHDATFLAMLIQISVVNRLCGYRAKQEGFQRAPVVAAIGGVSAAIRHLPPEGY